MFEEVKKNFGFGCMRLPMKEGEVDYEEFNKMIDVYLESGFNYFDTAHGYLKGKSETALRDCLVARYPRERYILTNKLTNAYIGREEDVRPFFESQLKICGVDYFDFYLMHAQSKSNFALFKRCRAYEQAFELKAEGKIKHVGISFHDTAEVLEQILREYPQIEVVQIQLNYVDYDDPAVQSRRCLEVCNKYRKPVIVMEPVKGGSLVKLPAGADAYFNALGSMSPASYAIRFAAGCEGVFMVLSGMSDTAQMRDNLSYMKNFVPLNGEEREAVQKVCGAFKKQGLIACTACRYCTDGCPKGISIPDLFACMNAKKTYRDWNVDYYYGNVYTKNGGKASECVACGKCEAKCPQHLPIRALLKDVAAVFESEREEDE